MTQPHRRVTHRASDTPTGEGLCRWQSSRARHGKQDVLNYEFARLRVASPLLHPNEPVRAVRISPAFVILDHTARLEANRLDGSLRPRSLGTPAAPAAGLTIASARRQLVKMIAEGCEMMCSAGFHDDSSLSVG